MNACGDDVRTIVFLGIGITVVGFACAYVAAGAFLKNGQMDDALVRGGRLLEHGPGMRSK